MSNTILTIDMITRAAVSLFKNSNMFIKNINTQYDNQFAVDGAKIGDTLRIRLPNDFVVRTGTALSAQDTSEKYTSLALQTQKGVDVAFSSAERTLKLDDYSERVLMPMMNNLAGGIAADIMSGVETGVCNFVSNVDGSGNIINPTSDTVLSAGAYLSDNSAPTSPGWKSVLDPWTEAKLVNTLSGLFNPTPEISQQYRTGKIKNALGFDFFMDQTVIKHTTGSFSAGGAMSSAGQTGGTITVSALTGTLNKGDIITIDGVYAVNRVTKLTTGKLRQFVVLADVASGGTSISIYPEIVPPVNGNAVQYQTVDSSPANAAQVRLVNKPSEIYRKNISYAPEAITLATADLVLPKGVHEAARREYDGISIRMITDYVIGTDQLATRLDVIYGYKYIRPEWTVATADKI
ncbi:P22 phage major capsid protein family protein [Rhizobium puerariae]|uniref:P22 phage major capsid protein family protein n=1 Tax=Rhizobium puerariae TaxID=1585791 RepID=A0ABV6AN38_9HYPH